MDIIEEPKTTSPEEEARLEQFNQSFINLMKTRDGRRFVWGMLERTGFTGQSFTGDRATTDFNCGQRNVGITLFAMIDQFCPDTFSLMMREAREDRDYDHGKHTTSGRANPTEFDPITAHTRPTNAIG